LQNCGLVLAFKPVVISFLFLLLIVLVLAGMPAWSYSRTWGYYPSALVGVLMSLLIVMAISGRL
jgi:hypothetical protein